MDCEWLPFSMFVFMGLEDSSLHYYHALKNESIVL